MAAAVARPGLFFRLLTRCYPRAYSEIASPRCGFSLHARLLERHVVPLAVALDRPRRIPAPTRATQPARKGGEGVDAGPSQTTNSTAMDRQDMNELNSDPLNVSRPAGRCPRRCSCRSPDARASTLAPVRGSH